MSIAAVSSALVSRLGAPAPVAATAPTAPVDGAASSSQRNHGRRHELVSAVVDALDVGAIDRHAEQAVFKFAHALLHDLREVGGATAGKRDWSDIGPRLDALVTAAAASSPAAPAVEPPSAVTPEPLPVEAPDAVEAAVAAAAAMTPSAVTATLDAPVEPSPLTATTAALHVMKVPSSRLVEAFQALRQAVPTFADVAGGDPVDAGAQLAAFLQRLAGVAPQGDDAAVAGAVLHATA